MWLRKILIAAAVAAPLTLSPIDASAQQQRGQERSAAARDAQAQATNQQLSEVPSGLTIAFEGDTPPDAVLRQFPGLEPVPDTGGDTGGGDGTTEEPCSEWIVFDSLGIPIGVEDCNGNFFPF